MSPKPSQREKAGGRPLKEHLRNHAPLVGVLILIAAGSWIGLEIWSRLAAPVVDEADIVTVTRHLDGYVGRHSQTRSFRHLVRTTSGAEYWMTFGELYPVGSRLSVNYRRFKDGGIVRVYFYSRIPD